VLAGAADAPEGGGSSSVRVSFSTHALLEAWGLASLSAMSGDFDEARRLCTNAKQIVDELGQKLRTASLGVVWGRIEVLADDPERAERVLRESYEILAEMGDKNVLSTVAAGLSDVVLAQGREQEAHRLAKESEALAAPDDVESQIRWRAASARLLAARGEPERAEAPARWAVGLAAGVEFPNLQATAALALAEVLRSGGREDEAEPFVSRALAHYELKGNLVSARKVRQMLVERSPRP
jgi:ATP/maltotriose-dependent transcriptional regulator MalT